MKGQPEPNYGDSLFGDYFVLGVLRIVGVSFQITVLKVLAGHPEGRTSLADLKRYVAVLACSGADWSQRMKRLAARAPGLDIFSSGYVLRESDGWRITDAGRSFLTSIEAPAVERTIEPVAGVVAPATPHHLPANVTRLVDHVASRRRAAA